MSIFDFLGGLFGGSGQPSSPALLDPSAQPQQQEPVDPVTGMTPTQLKWSNALAGFGAAMKDAGASLQGDPGAANNVANFQKQMQLRNGYGGLVNSLVGTKDPNGGMYGTTNPDDPNALSPFKQYSGSLPDAQASQLSDVLKYLTPEQGLPLIMQMLSPKDSLVVHPGDTVLDGMSKLPVFSAPALPDFSARPDVALNPASGKPEQYVIDTKSGNVKWLGSAPVQSTVVSPDEATQAGLPNIGPGWAWQKDPEGKYTPIGPPGMLSPQAYQQQVDLRGAEAKAVADNNPSPDRQLAALLGKKMSGQQLTPDEQQTLAILKPTAVVDPSEIEDQAKAIANYQVAPPSGFASGKPLSVAIMNRVMQINPNYQAQQYSASQAGYRAFTSGKQGDQMRFADNAVGHLGTLNELADALTAHNGNGDLPAINAAFNAISKQFGGAPVTNFNTAKQIVANEVVKAIVGAGGAEGDRIAAQNAFDAASSPAQLKGAIQTAQTLLTRQLQGLGRQYQRSTLRNDFAQQLSPETAAMLSVTGTPAPAGVIRYDAQGNRLQ